MGKGRSRREKYPDTDTFCYYNANPKNRITGDCVYRAFSLALGIPYKRVVIEMAINQCKTGYAMGDTKGIISFLESKGWKKCPQLKHDDGTKYTVADFVKAHKSGIYIINMAHHVSVIKDGKNYDIWDCVKYGGTVGNYFCKDNDSEV